MAMYKYIGRTEKGALKKGTIESATKNQAIQLLREKGIRPRELTETKATLLNKDISIVGDRVKSEDFVIFARQFATLIRAGISIVDAVKILAQQTESKGLQKALGIIEVEIKEGRSFSEAAARHPKAFPPLFINMVRAGEASGEMDATLDRLANHYEKQNALMKKVKSTLSYPAVLLVVIIAVVIFLMIYIVPQFVTTFESFGAELPFMTVMVMSISDFLVDFWYVLLILLVLTVTAFMVTFKNSRQFQYTIYVGLLKLPVFGKLIQKSVIAQMTRTLASLFASSVPILQALKIVEKIVANPVIQKVIQEAHANLEEGKPLSEPILKSWVFPPLVGQMIAIGEQTGQLDFMLGKVADFFEEDVERTVDTLKSMIEPLMIVLLAGVVGFIVIAIMMPMFSVYEQL
ncbi:type II secretion system F family protein [Oceanobacillus indicireducens]|uniref:Phytochrome sensor protein n=1 Tax=Oceanobacillus indicireducens TaxID=1004261 RepID=A0A918CYB8_9BACI|nr:type II secretion system F family protein [Oceanobacillus indicireducens]GGN48862.1 phytochrome sensor protein [Oceanobacillus indicireducens]